MQNTYTWHSSQASLNSPDTIHQILRYGTLNDIRELQKKIGHHTVKDSFLNHPKNIYSLPSLNFISKFVLSIEKPLNENAYLTSTPRHIG